MWEWQQARILENNTILPGKAKWLTQGMSNLALSSQRRLRLRKQYKKILEVLFKFNSYSSTLAFGSFASTSWDKSTRSFRIPSSERNQAINSVYEYFSIHMFIGHLYFLFGSICSSLVHFLLGYFSFPNWFAEVFWFVLLFFKINVNQFICWLYTAYMFSHFIAYIFSLLINRVSHVRLHRFILYLLCGWGFPLEQIWANQTPHVASLCSINHIYFLEHNNVMI